MRGLWNWFRWITLPARHRREIDSLEADDAIILATKARIERDMAKMGMDPNKWWTERGRHIFEGRKP